MEQKKNLCDEKPKNSICLTFLWKFFIHSSSSAAMQHHVYLIHENKRLAVIILLNVLYIIQSIIFQTYNNNNNMCRNWLKIIMFNRNQRISRTLHSFLSIAIFFCWFRSSLIDFIVKTEKNYDEKKNHRFKEKYAIQYKTAQYTLNLYLYDVTFKNNRFRPSFFIKSFWKFGDYRKTNCTRWEWRANVD